MLKLIIQRQMCMFSKLNIDKFSRKDYETMCQLLRQKYPVYNQAIQVRNDIKLLDENGKLVGQYEASQARKKASTLKKDIILINYKSVPIICKLVPFRQRILNSFYDQIVVKRNQQLLKRASSTKHLKISLKLTENDLVIKTKQIIELSKKNLNVRIFINCKQSQVEEAYQKLDTVKASLQNKCIIQRDMNVNQQQEDEDEVQEDQKTKQDRRKTVSITVKSKKNQFMQSMSESTKKQPQSVIQTFLKKYYKQQDTQMMDLKAKANIKTQNMFQNMTFNKQQQKKVQQTSLKGQKKDILGNQADFQKRLKKKNMLNMDGIKQQSLSIKIASDRILSDRLKRILQTNIE